jgi:hypothetical protein
MDLGEGSFDINVLVLAFVVLLHIDTAGRKEEECGEIEDGELVSTHCTS